MSATTYYVFMAETEDGRSIADVLIPNTFWNPVLSSMGLSKDECLSQIRKGLKAHLRRQGWLPAPYDWLKQPDLMRVSVDLCPGYRQGNRYFSGDRNYKLDVTVMHGPVEDGDGSLATIPRLKLAFHYFEEKSLVETVRNEVRRFFIEAPVERIAQALPYKQESLELVRVNVPRVKLRRQQPPDESILARVGERLSKRRLRSLGGPCYERDSEVQSVLTALKEGVSGLLILGESGTGKSSIVYDAFKRILRGADINNEDQSSTWSTSTPSLYRLDGSRIIAGMEYVGGWEERCHDICEQLTHSNSILFSGDLVSFLTAGRSSASARGLDTIFGPYIERNEVRIILETTPRGLEVAEHMAPGFTDLFKIVRVEQADRHQSLRILEKVLIEKLPGTQERPIELSALIYDLCRRFQPQGCFPGKAVPLARELAPKDSSDALPTSSEVIDAFSVRTGIPNVFLDDQVPLAPSETAEFYEARIIGQDQARDAAVAMVATLKAGLNDPRRPIASLLLCGPTGVGKTELAKCLAEYFFSGRDRLIRLDMSEYGLPGSLSRLIGDIALGPGELTKRIHDQPFSVVLFDEVEKADPAVFDILMGVFDEGRLTDPFGKIADFRSAILVMTSNLGSMKGAALGFSDGRQEAENSRVMKAVSEFFRPEFVNRLDKILMFSALGQEQCLKITRRELAKLCQREGFVRRGLKLEFADRVSEVVAEQGFDEKYGARPLKRAIDRMVTTPLAQRLSADPSIQKGTLHLDFNDKHELLVEVAP